MQHLGALSRRNLLKTGLVGSLVVGLSGLGIGLQDTALRPDTPKLKVFDAREYAILCAVAERLCPAYAPDAPGALALDTAGRIDALAAQVDPDVQRGFKLALKALESALFGAVLGERVRPFTALSDGARDRVLAAWRDSRIGFRRTVYRALSVTIMAAYWGDERTWPRLGYAGPPDAAALRAAYADNLAALSSLRHRAEEAQGS